MNTTTLSSNKFTTDPMTMTALLSTTTDTLNVSHATIAKRRNHHKDSSVTFLNDNKYEIKNSNGNNSTKPPRTEWSSSTIVATNYLDVMAARKRQNQLSNKSTCI